MRKKLKPRKSPPKSCAPALAARACARTGWKARPRDAGSMVRFNEAAKSFVRASAKRNAVRFPKRLDHIPSAAASVTNALGVPRYSFQYFSSLGRIFDI